MLLCPVDLAVCDRPGCAGGRCEMAAEPRLTVCWECGEVVSHGVVAGICVACVRVYAATDRLEA